MLLAGLSGGVGGWGEGEQTLAPVGCPQCPAGPGAGWKPGDGAPLGHSTATGWADGCMCCVSRVCAHEPCLLVPMATPARCRAGVGRPWQVPWGRGRREEAAAEVGAFPVPCRQARWAPAGLPLCPSTRLMAWRMRELGALTAGSEGETDWHPYPLPLPGQAWSPSPSSLIRTRGRSSQCVHEVICWAGSVPMATAVTSQRAGGGGGWVRPWRGILASTRLPAGTLGWARCPCRRAAP